ncbi:exported protein of unknown function [Modestobacter italicus]|uniref:Uncharacterized protein n=1 Tax=Modestobacter italicus (strain DSM 44449 / CECT 9708 / BC 501) TaxID=2732864 RepID=I4EUP8_MODI5|nr:exported protein of unknown function [Modestobacter marinus]
MTTQAVLAAVSWPSASPSTPSSSWSPGPMGGGSFPGCGMTSLRAAQHERWESEAATRALGFSATGGCPPNGSCGGELPWRGHCFEATACRLPVRPWG